MAHSPQDRLTAAKLSGRIYTIDEKAEILFAGIIPAPPHIAATFCISREAPIIRRHRIVSTVQDGAVVAASTSWFSADLAEVAPELLSLERIPEGTAHYIARMTDRTVDFGMDRFCAGTASQGEAVDLDISPDSPVLRGRNWIRDTAGNIIEFGESVTYANRWVSYEYHV